MYLCMYVCHLLNMIIIMLGKRFMELRIIQNLLHPDVSSLAQFRSKYSPQHPALKYRIKL
jgi:hypothetical protein